MSKSNANQPDITAEMYINLYDVEILLNALDKYYTDLAYKQGGTGGHCMHLYHKLSQLYNELKGGNHAKPLV